MPRATTTTLAEVISLETLRALEVAAEEITCIPTVICDNQGRPLDAGGCWKGVLGILRSTPNGQERVDKLFAKLAVDGQTPGASTLVWRATAIGAADIRPGTIIAGPVLTAEPSPDQWREVGHQFDLGDADLDRLRTMLRPSSPEVIQRSTRLVGLLSSVLGRLAVKVRNLQHREFELNAVHQLSHMMSGTLDLKVALKTIARQVCEVMGVKASSIRLLNEETHELLIEAVHNLSSRYLNKGPVILSENAIDRAAFAGEAVYVRDAATDPRIRFREHAHAEGGIL